MIKREYYCKNCDFVFERVSLAEDEKVKCPLCGKDDLSLKSEEEKKPAFCDTAGKYT